VLEVAVDQLERRRLALHQVDLGVVLPPHHAVDVVALGRQELRERAAVLPGDPGDERARHEGRRYWSASVATSSARTSPCDAITDSASRRTSSRSTPGAQRRWTVITTPLPPGTNPTPMTPRIRRT